MHTKRLTIIHTTTTLHTRQLQQYTQHNKNTHKKTNNNTHKTTATIHTTQLKAIQTYRIIQLYKFITTQRCGLSQTKEHESSQYFCRPISRHKQLSLTQRGIPIKMEPEISKAVNFSVSIAINRITSVCTLWTAESEALS